MSMFRKIGCDSVDLGIIKDDFQQTKKVIFIPGTSKSGEYKKWPSDKYAQVAKYLASRNLSLIHI